jgi:hypothetical protein
MPNKITQILFNNNLLFVFSSLDKQYILNFNNISSIEINPIHIVFTTQNDKILIGQPVEFSTTYSLRNYTNLQDIIKHYGNTSS